MIKWVIIFLLLGVGCNLGGDRSKERNECEYQSERFITNLIDSLGMTAHVNVTCERETMNIQCLFDTNYKVLKTASDNEELVKLLIFNSQSLLKLNSNLTLEFDGYSDSAYFKIDNTLIQIVNEDLKLKKYRDLITFSLRNFDGDDFITFDATIRFMKKELKNTSENRNYWHYLKSFVAYCNNQKGASLKEAEIFVFMIQYLRDADKEDHVKTGTYKKFFKLLGSLGVNPEIVGMMGPETREYLNSLH